MRQVFSCIVLLVFSTHYGFSSESEATTRVLFIGNSYTYYHSMPQLFSAMAEVHFPDRQIETKFVGRGGATLKQLWEDGGTLKEIQSGKWSFVILQEQSMLGEEIIENGKSYVRSPDQFFEYATKFVQVSLENGSDPVFYMTWSRKEYPQQQKYLNYAYMTIARETGSKITPVGITWDKLRDEPLFDLYESDGSHPSVYGSYLAALMLFSVVFDTDPTGMPATLHGYEILKGGGISDEKKVLCDLPEHEIQIIQNDVSETFKLMKQGNGYLDVEKAVSDKKPSNYTKLVTYLSDSRNQFVILIIVTGMIVIVKYGLLFFKNQA